MTDFDWVKARPNRRLLQLRIAIRRPSLTATPHAHRSKTVTRKVRGHFALVSYIPLNKSF